MSRKNVCRQALIEQNQALRALETKRDTARAAYSAAHRRLASAAPEEQATIAAQVATAQAAYEAFDPQLANARALVTLAEQDLESATRAERAELDAVARNPGAGLPHVPGFDYGRAHTSGANAFAGPAPDLPPSARAALDQLYGGTQSSSPADVHARFQDLAAAVLSGTMRPAGVFAATGSEGIAGDGGYLVDTEVSQEIFARALSESVFVRAGVRVEAMKSSEKTIVALDDSNETGNLHAGLTAAWRAEGESFGDFQRVKLRRVKLVAKKCGVLAQTTNELDQDSGRYQNTLDQAVITTLSKVVDRTIFSATGGAGTPQGILGAACTITVSKLGGQAADTIEYQNLSDMWARLPPDSMERAVWLFHPSCYTELKTLVVNVGTSGFQPRDVFEPDGRGGGLLLGRPAFATARINRLGDLGDIVLIDPQAYVIGLRRSFQIDRSEHVSFTTDELAIRGTWRGDGQPMWESTQTLEDGVTTVGPFVVLEAR